MKPQRAAVYLRVSTRDQTVANQVPDLERLLSERRLAIAGTYQDEESGVRRRPELERLMKDAVHHRFEVVVVWALDRLGRNMAEVVANVLELERLGVDLLSAREPWLNTIGPARSLLVSVFAWVAQQERARLVERTHAGLARARAAGTRLGRPPRVVDVGRARELAGEGLSLRKIAQRLRVPKTTLDRALRGCPRMGQNSTPQKPREN